MIVISAGTTLDDMLASMPAFVVASIGREGFAKVFQTMRELQLDLVKLSTQGKQVIAGQSTHYIQWDQPELVIAAIRELVEQVRGE